MAAKITTTRISEILLEEFMEPMGLSAYRLAKDINVPTSRIQDILHDRRKITADTSLRLAKYFGVSDCYFLNIQNEIDMRNIRLSIGDEIDRIVPFSLTDSSQSVYMSQVTKNAIKESHTNLLSEDTQDYHGVRKMIDDILTKEDD